MEFHHKNISVSRFKKIDRLAFLMGKDADLDFKREAEEKFSKYVLGAILTVPLVKGAQKFLNTMKSRVPLYLASVTPESELCYILQKRDLLHWFDGVYGCPPWTKAGAIRDLLLQNGISKKSAILIGDSAGDQKAALEVGIHFIGRDSGLKFDEPPPFLFSDLNEITNYLLPIIK
jgi:phosphoglycolate phosphatase-like HAD superfamily hydrolase